MPINPGRRRQISYAKAPSWSVGSLQKVEMLRLHELIGRWAECTEIVDSYRLGNVARQEFGVATFLSVGRHLGCLARAGCRSLNRRICQKANDSDGQD